MTDEIAADVRRLRPRLIIITGQPGAWKTTLAHVLATRFGLPLIARGAIKAGSDRRLRQACVDRHVPDGGPLGDGAASGPSRCFCGPRGARYRQTIHTGFSLYLSTGRIKVAIDKPTREGVRESSFLLEACSMHGPRRRWFDAFPGPTRAPRARVSRRPVGI